MRLLHAGVPDAGGGVLEREPDISDEDLLDVLASNLCRCTGYQNIVKAVRAAAKEMRGSMTASANLSAGRVPRLEDRPLLTGLGPLRRRHFLPRPLHMRVVRSPIAHGRLQVDRRVRALKAARRACGVDRGRRWHISRRSAFASPASQCSSPTDSRCWRATSCAMSASRSRRFLPTTLTSPKTPPRPRIEVEIEHAGQSCTRQEPAPVSDEMALEPSRDAVPKAYGDLDAAFARRARDRRT